MGRFVLARVKRSVGTRIEAPLMDALTDLGARWGVDWLVYNPLRMRMYHRYARRDAGAVISALTSVMPEARSLADVGCGTGAFAAEAQRRGYRVVGCERSRFGRWLASRQGVHCVPFDLRYDPPAVLGRRVDLAYSLEVGEHLEPALGDRLVTFLTRLAPVVVYTAAQPGQGGAGHVNERPPEYWHARFRIRGFTPDAPRSRRLSDEIARRGDCGGWLAGNVTVYVANEVTPVAARRSASSP